MAIELPLADLTELIIAKGMVVHSYFGPGLLETVYKECMGLLLVDANLVVEIERPVPVHFRSLSFDRRVREPDRRTTAAHARGVSDVSAARRAAPAWLPRKTSEVNLPSLQELPRNRPGQSQ